MSICVPVYNCGGWLVDCLTSIVSQLPKGCEVVVVDDGSTDGSGEVADNFAIRYSSMRVIHQVNAGLPAARIVAVSSARGVWIMSVDGDDSLEDGVLDAVLMTLKESSPDVLVLRYLEVKDGVARNPSSLALVRETIESTDRNRIISTFFNTKSLNSAWGKVIRRSLIDLNSLSCTTWVHMGEDWFFSFAPMVQAHTFKFLNVPVYRYMIRTSSMTGSYDYSYWRALVEMYRWKTDAASSGTVAVQEFANARINLLVEIAKALAFVPAFDRNERRYAEMVRAVASNDELHDAWLHERHNVPLPYRVIIGLLYHDRPRVLFAVKCIASLLRRR